MTGHDSAMVAIASACEPVPFADNKFDKAWSIRTPAKAYIHWPARVLDKPQNDVFSLWRGEVPHVQWWCNE
jgi:hypothetical protein